MSRKPKPKEGNRNIHIGNGSYIEGDVEIKGGDFVGGKKEIGAGDKSVIINGSADQSTVIAGDHNTAIGEQTNITRLFQQIYTTIDQRPETSPEAKADLKSDVKEIEAEARKGKDADESFLARRLRSIQRMAPDILEVVLNTLTNPASGIATVIRKIGDHIKSSGTETAGNQPKS